MSCNTDKNSNENTENTDENTSVLNIEKMSTQDLLNFELDFTHYAISTSENEEIITERGTIINIPEGAFVYENGNEYSGDVDLRFREIVSAADIITTDVEMVYDSAGNNYIFQTAGMFEIEAYSTANKPLKLKQGKEINVTFNSINYGSYGFYKYNKEEENWNYNSSSTIIEKLPENTSTTYLKPEKVDPVNDYVIRLDIPVNFSELRIYSNLLWVYDGDKTNNEVDNILSQKVTNSYLEKDGSKYILFLKTANELYKLPVKPAFSENNYNIAIEKFNNTTNNFQPNNQILSNNNPVKRKKSISMLGLYNFDRFKKNNGAINVMASFNLNGKHLKDFTLFQIAGYDDVVIKYEVKNRSEFYYFPTESNKLIGIMPDGKVVYLTAEAFKEQTTTKTSNFELIEKKDQINNNEELDNFIALL